jgi:hypothetical protein
MAEAGAGQQRPQHRQVQVALVVVVPVQPVRVTASRGQQT